MGCEEQNQITAGTVYAIRLFLTVARLELLLHVFTVFDLLATFPHF